MTDYLKNNPLTAFILALTFLVALVGAIVVILQPETLSFAAYLDRLEKFAIALGVLGIGHGVLGAGEKVAQAKRLDSLTADPGDTKSHDRAEV